MTEIITTINGVAIECYLNTEGYNDSEKDLVSIRNICEALQIDYEEEKTSVWNNPMLKLLLKINPKAVDHHGAYYDHSFPVMYTLGYIAIAGGEGSFVPDRMKCYLDFYEYLSLPF